MGGVEGTADGPTGPAEYRCSEKVLGRLRHQNQLLSASDQNKQLRPNSTQTQPLTSACWGMGGRLVGRVSPSQYTGCHWCRGLRQTPHRQMATEDGHRFFRLSVCFNEGTINSELGGRDPDPAHQRRGAGACTCRPTRARWLLVHSISTNFTPAPNIRLLLPPSPPCSGPQTAAAARTSLARARARVPISHVDADSPSPEPPVGLDANSQSDRGAERNIQQNMSDCIPRGTEPRLSIHPSIP